jgi:pimeloyl-ACP methyl ester carboxylesterase
MPFLNNPSRKTYILIHGAWHGKWCWKYITPILEKYGHDVIAIDLPGHGENQRNFRKISLESYINAIYDIIKLYNKKIILIGHSMAGVIISQIAEYLPDHIEELIYITAFIPDNNSTLSAEAQKSLSSGILKETNINLRENSIALKNSPALIDLFLNRCKKKDIDFSLDLLQKEPYRPFINPIAITPDKFGRVKKTYIHCLYDNVILPADQNRMALKNICNRISIPADHSPFFSSPEQLAKAIMGA